MNFYGRYFVVLVSLTLDRDMIVAWFQNQEDTLKINIIGFYK